MRHYTFFSLFFISTSALAGLFDVFNGKELEPEFQKQYDMESKSITIDKNISGNIKISGILSNADKYGIIKSISTCINDKISADSVYNSLMLDHPYLKKQKFSYINQKLGQFRKTPVSKKSFHSDERNMFYTNYMVFNYPQAAFTSNMDYGLTKTLSYDVKMDNTTINLSLLEITSQINFNPLTAGLTSVSNYDDKVRLLKISSKFNELIDNTFQSCIPSAIMDIRFRIEVDYDGDKEMLNDAIKSVFGQNEDYANKNNAIKPVFSQNRDYVGKYSDKIGNNVTIYKIEPFKQKSGLKLKCDIAFIGNAVNITEEDIALQINLILTDLKKAKKEGIVLK